MKNNLISACKNILFYFPWVTMLLVLFVSINAAIGRDTSMIAIQNLYVYPLIAAISLLPRFIYVPFEGKRLTRFNNFLLRGIFLLLTVVCAVIAIYFFGALVAMSLENIIRIAGTVFVIYTILYLITWHHNKRLADAFTKKLDLLNKEGDDDVE